MPLPQLLPLHGGATGAVDMLVGLGPVILGATLIGAFIVLLSFDRSASARSGYRDERPTSARLLFSGTYYRLSELLRETDDPSEASEAARREPERPGRAR